MQEPIHRPHRQGARDAAAARRLKATTNETMGFVGLREGIAAMVGVKS